MPHPGSVDQADQSVSSSPQQAGPGHAGTVATSRGVIRAIAIGLLSVVAATGISLLLRGYTDATPFALLHLAVLVSTLAAGALAGWIAVGSAVVAAAWVLLGPPTRMAQDPRLLGSLLLSAFVAAAIVVLATRLRRAVAESERQHRATERFSRLYDALRQISRTIALSRTEEALFTNACRALVERGGFRMAWIGLPDPASHRLVPAAIAGDAQGYLSRARVYVDDRPEGRGPSGRAFRSGRPNVTNDVGRDPSTAPWRKEAARSGFRAAAVFPIRRREEVYGTLTVYAAERDFFQAAEIALLDEAATELSAALDNFVRESERAAAEEEARRERALVEQVFESVPGVIYLYDEEGRFRRWNQRFLDVTGYTDADMATAHPLDFFRGADVPLLTERIGAVLATGEGQVEAAFVARDGTATPYFFTGRRVTLEGQPHLVGVGIDISQRVAAELAYRELSRQFEVVVENLREGLVVATPDLSDLHWNPAALRLLGFDDVDEGRRRQREFEEIFLLSTLDGEAVPADRWPLARTRAGESVMGLELRVRRRDSDLDRIISYAGACVDAGNGAQLAFVTLHDVTDRHRAAQALLEANVDLERQVEARTADLRAALMRAESADRLKSAFLATMSHELRTPLNSIIGFNGMLLKELAGPLTAEQKKQLGMALGSARHLLELINDVLDISKIEAGQLVVRREPVDLRASVEKVVAVIGPMAEAKGLEVRVTVPAGLPPLAADRRRVDQVLLNLLSNAVKFTERGTVGLVVSPAGPVPDGGAPRPRALRIEVRDSGIGIKPADLATLFQPFRQLDTGLSRTHEGTGLGLAISRRLCELMGGTIAAQSTWGRGSTFAVTLPAAPEG